MYRVSTAAAAAALALVCSSASLEAAQTPKILSSDQNRVPSCVQPDRMMAFLKNRNKKVDENFKDVALFYKKHGAELKVRWDYAFYQMIVETNYLTYKTGSGRWGDVRPTQNNFAGIGATGGGVRGESFDDVSTGVLAHIGHIRLYSGKPVDEPAAKRTKLVEEIILPWAQGMGRAVTFTDLTTKWSPGDKEYSDDIELVAKAYRASFCTNENEIETIATTDEVTASQDDPAADETVVADAADVAADSSDTTAGLTNSKTAKASEEIDRVLEETAADTEVQADDSESTVASSGTTAASMVSNATAKTTRKNAKAVEKVVALMTPSLPKGGACKVFTASYGGAKSLLIEAAGDAGVVYTALAVNDGKESAQAQAFINAYAKGGRSIGEYGSVDQALTKAFELCPEG